MKVKRKIFVKTAVFFGLLFIALPNISVIDPTPDFIGWLLILAGLKELFPLERSLSDTPGKMRRLVILSVLRSIAAPIIIYIAVGDRTFYMLGTFVFSVFEPIFGIGAFFSLFDGVADIGYRSEAKSPLKHLGAIKTATALFFILKAVLNFLPELCYIGMSDSLTQRLFPMEKYRLPMTLVCLAAGILVGIVWCVFAFTYFARLRGDGALSDELEKRNAERIENPDAGEILKSAGTLMFIGLLFFCDLPLDGFNILPDIIGALLIITAAKRLKKMPGMTELFEERLKRLTVFSFIHGAVSTVSLIGGYAFAIRFRGAGEEMLPIMTSDILLLTVLSALSLASLVALCVCLFVVMKEMTEMKTAGLSDETTPLLHTLINKKTALALALSCLAELISVIVTAMPFGADALPFISVALGVLGAVVFRSAVGEQIANSKTKNGIE